MEITIKEKLKELRKKNNITQEQLANHLGISQQSVCKWERDEGYPDITLLPSIALFFGITLDELMGLDEARINSSVDAYISESQALLNAGDIKSDLELWKKAYKEFPQNDQVKFNYMHALDSLFMYDPKENADMSKEIIRIGEELLNTTKDTEIREGAIQILCFAYNMSDDKENAKKYANMACTSYCVTRSELLADILTGNEATAQHQQNIYDLIDLLALNIRGMRYNGNYETAAKRIHLHLLCINFYSAVFENEDYGFYSCRLTQNYRDIAFEYATLGNADACLDALESMAKYAVITDTQPDFKHNSPLVNLLEYKSTSSTKNYTENECALRLKGLQNEAYNFVRENPRFIKLSEELTKHAN